MSDYIFNSVSCKSLNVLKKLIKVNDSFLFGKLENLHWFCLRILSGVYFPGALKKSLSPEQIEEDLINLGK